MPELDKPKNVRADSVVWCNHHGCIHENSLDPYNTGTQDCLTDAQHPYNNKRSVHRTVYVGLRKGDWHEKGEEF